MSIQAYLKEIGRGKDGARSLSRQQAAELMGHILDGRVSELALGAFCAAMRIKGETPAEMAGFCDAAHARLTAPAMDGNPVTIVLPSYNGARRLPLLTPLLAGLLLRHGLAVLIHGCASEHSRACTLEHMWPHLPDLMPTSASLRAGHLSYCPTERLHPGLHRLLQVRLATGLRNSGHSLVKLLMPVPGPALLVTSYTHPEYRHSMAQTLLLTGTRALLLRGTEGEPVADPRRSPAMEAVWDGHIQPLQDTQPGCLGTLPALPPADAASTARWTADVLSGQREIPAPLHAQIQHILSLVRQLKPRPAQAPSPRPSEPTPSPAATCAA